jgi:aminoglycoside phosphotransferase (APT) family kinase protein
MAARQDGSLAAVAGGLGLDFLAVLGGGEFGAALVRDPDGRELVLKVLPGAEWAARFARGAALSARVRSDEYPIPRYVGTGVSSGVSWSLQEHLDGEVPEVMSAAHAQQLLALVRRHADAARSQGDVLSRFDHELEGAAERVADHPDTATLARELADALAIHDASVRTADVVHGDFHHRNYLAVGDQVTGVFDWELAWVGDWRVDLVNLACWAMWVPWQIPPAASHVIIDSAVAACEPDVLALFTAFHTLRALDFIVRHHPDRVTRLLETVNKTTRSWLHPR